MNVKELERFSTQAMPVLMRKVYTWMALALVITGVCAYGVAASPTLIMAIFSSKMTFYGLLIAELALVIFISARIDRLSLSTATLLFTVYAALNGVTLSAIFLLYDITTIGQVFFITAGTFGAMAFFGYTTKKDLSVIGHTLYMALIGLILATVVNLFMRNAMLDYILSYIGVGVFVGLTAWDSQKIKRILSEMPDAGEEAQKFALLGALTLYLDFINLFLYLLRIFSKRR
jgi:Integral membrane protein, interacts with FtsH